jgi:hypothetical protein
MKMEQTKCSETSAHKIQTPGNHLKERMKYSENGESLKSEVLFTTVNLVTLFISRYKNRLSLFLEGDKKYTHSQIETVPRDKPDSNQPS